MWIPHSKTKMNLWNTVRRSVEPKISPYTYCTVKKIQPIADLPGFFTGEACNSRVITWKDGGSPRRSHSAITMLWCLESKTTKAYLLQGSATCRRSSKRLQKLNYRQQVPLDTRMSDSGHKSFHLSVILTHFIARKAKLSHRSSGMANANQISIYKQTASKDVHLFLRDKQFTH